MNDLLALLVSCQVPLVQAEHSQGHAVWGEMGRCHMHLGYSDMYTKIRLSSTEATHNRTAQQTGLGMTRNSWAETKIYDSGCVISSSIEDIPTVEMIPIQ